MLLSAFIDSSDTTYWTQLVENVEAFVLLKANVCENVSTLFRREEDGS